MPTASELSYKTLEPKHHTAKKYIKKNQVIAPNTFLA